MGIFGRKRDDDQQASSEPRPVELLRSFTPEQYAEGLSDWAWLGLDDLAPVAATSFGDVFLQGRGGLWFLDTVEGALT